MKTQIHERKKRIVSLGLTISVTVTILAAGGILTVAKAQQATATWKRWMDGEPLTAADLNGNFDMLRGSSVPSGAVIAFDLTECPTGWATYAPASGRTVVGIGPGLTRGAPVGADQITLTTSNLPAHSHNGTTQSGKMLESYIIVNSIGHSFAPNHGVGWDPNNAARTYGPSSSFPMASHVHDFTTSSVGEGRAVDNRQASVPLLYCKKN